MFLYSMVAAILFGFFQIKPVMFGPAGIAFEVSMAMIGAIGILHWLFEYYKFHVGTPFGLVQDQLKQFMNLHLALKLVILLFALALPMVVASLR